MSNKDELVKKSTEDIKDKLYDCLQSTFETIEVVKNDLSCIYEGVANDLDIMKANNSDVEEAYNKGLEDAWELIKKITVNDYRKGGYDSEEVQRIFGTENLFYILKHHTPQEALAKLEAYEKEQTEIKVGDVVQTHNAREYVVIATSEELPTNQPLLRNLHDNSVCFGTNKDLIKTGKHIDIQSVLEQIGGAE